MRAGGGGVSKGDIGCSSRAFGYQLDQVVKAKSGDKGAIIVIEGY